MTASENNSTRRWIGLGVILFITVNSGLSVVKLPLEDILISSGLSTWSVILTKELLVLLALIIFVSRLSNYYGKLSDMNSPAFKKHLITLIVVFLVCHTLLFIYATFRLEILPESFLQQRANFATLGDMSAIAAGNALAFMDKGLIAFLLLRKKNKAKS